MSVIEITSSKQFEEELSRSQYVLVDFCATWCGPCKAMESTVASLAKTYSQVLTVCSVDADICPDVQKKYKVTGLPTFLLFFNGTGVQKIVGANPEILKKAVQDMCARK